MQINNMSATTLRSGMTEMDLDSGHMGRDMTEIDLRLKSNELRK